MKKPAVSLVIAVLLTTTMAFSQTAAQKSTAEVSLGVASYKQHHYPEAVTHFQEALRLDPSNQNAAAYLASTYMVQWVPAVDTPENTRNYELAKQGYERMLEKNPTNSLALASLACLALNKAANGTDDQKATALAEARKWNQLRVEIDPLDDDAWYYLGVIAWTQASQPIQAARISAAMHPDDPWPLADASAREALKTKYGATIDSGIQALLKCLEIDQDRDDAMSYLNLLYRERAALVDSFDAAAVNGQLAATWKDRSVAMKKTKTARAPQR